MSARAFHAGESVEFDKRHFRMGEPRMTRVHFRVIAEGLATSKPTYGGPLPTDLETARAQWWRSCLHVASRLALTNPNFDRERFLMWCTA